MIASMLHAPAPANVRYRKKKQYITAATPLLTVGKKDWGAWNWKYATAISPASTNAIGRVKTPSTIARPPNNSRIPPIPSCDVGLNGGIGIGLGGEPNTIIDPAVMKTSPATMRRTASMRLGQGGGAGSKIDIGRLFCVSIEKM
jgi:hypothetical protein